MNVQRAGDGVEVGLQDGLLVCFGESVATVDEFAQSRRGECVRVGPGKVEEHLEIEVVLG